MLYCKNKKCYEKNGNIGLIENEVDDRQEWCDIFYHCKECGTNYRRKIIYKTQSSLVSSDILYMVIGKNKEIEVE